MELLANGYWSEARANPTITALLDNPTDLVARNKVRPTTDDRRMGACLRADTRDMTRQGGSHARDIGEGQGGTVVTNTQSM